MTKAAKRTAKKRLTPSQVEALEMMARYDDFTYLSGLPTLRILVGLGLAEEGRIGKFKQVRAWRITHDGMIVLKQNGHYPADPAWRSSVRDPRKTPSTKGAAG